MPNPISSWTDERTFLARELYESGKHSNAQIARRLGGVSRNGVIGKANREGWVNPNPKRGGTKPGEKRPRAAGWSRKSALSIFGNLSRNDPGEASLPAQITPPEFLALTLVELGNRQCHYIPGNDRLYCGQPTEGESSYCGWCRKIIYQPMYRSHGRLTLVPVNSKG